MARGNISCSTARSEMADTTWISVSPVWPILDQPDKQTFRRYCMTVVADSKFPVGMISEEPGLDSDDDNPVPPSPSPRQPNLTLHLYLGLIGAQDIPRERAISTSIFLGLKPGEAADERLRKSTSSSTSEWMYKKWKEWEFCGETDWFRESSHSFQRARFGSRQERHTH